MIRIVMLIRVFLLFGVSLILTIICLPAVFLGGSTFLSEINKVLSDEFRKIKASFIAKKSS